MVEFLQIVRAAFINILTLGWLTDEEKGFLSRWWQRWGLRPRPALGSGQEGSRALCGGEGRNPQLLLSVLSGNLCWWSAGSQ